MPNELVGDVKRWRLLLGIALAALLASVTVLAAAQPAHAALNPNIVITESGGSTNVHPDGPLIDSYTIRLAVAPTDWVRFTISTSYGGGTSFAQISVDGGTTWSDSGVVVIFAGDTSEHTVLVRWADPTKTPDDFPPSARVMTVMHPADSFDGAYDFTDGPNVYVGMEAATIDPNLPGGPNTPGTPTPPSRIDTAAA